jgi:hypothetical protein
LSCNNSSSRMPSACRIYLQTSVRLHHSIRLSGNTRTIGSDAIHTRIGSTRMRGEITITRAHNRTIICTLRTTGLPSGLPPPLHQATNQRDTGRRLHLSSPSQAGSLTLKAGSRTSRILRATTTATPTHSNTLLLRPVPHEPSTQTRNPPSRSSELTTHLAGVQRCARMEARRN